MRPSIFVLALVLASREASALPRFAARNGMECIQCHVNPTGGGMRNAYGANVFEKVWLPLAPDIEGWMAPSEDPPPGETKEGEEQPAEESSTFSGTLFEWLSVGGDLRGAYLFVRPDEPAMPGARRDVTNSFFLMQADLYHAARLNRYVTLMLDVGVYSGFEAWGLVKPIHGEPFDLAIKVGRFLPPFGIREVEHQLFTREGVGLGQTDRDTGVEVTAWLGPVTISSALLNGTLGDLSFDSSGSERRTFEKASATRAAVRAMFGPLRLQLGGSFYYNQNINQPNPLFTGLVPSALQAETARGLDELRAGAFLTLNLGRFTYLGDLVAVRDAFHSDRVPRLLGHAVYQEVSFIPAQGVELVLTHELMDPDHDLAGTITQRFGFVTEVFPLPFTELRAMARRTLSDQSKTGGSFDVVLFLHLFM